VLVIIEISVSLVFMTALGRAFGLTPKLTSCWPSAVDLRRFRHHRRGGASRQTKKRRLMPLPRSWR